jgi:hypothetical protein
MREDSGNILKISFEDLYDEESSHSGVCINQKISVIKFTGTPENSNK